MSPFRKCFNFVMPVLNKFWNDTMRKNNIMLSAFLFLQHSLMNVLVVLEIINYCEKCSSLEHEVVVGVIFICMFTGSTSYSLSRKMLHSIMKIWSLFCIQNINKFYLTPFNLMDGHLKFCRTVVENVLQISGFSK